MEKEMAKVKGKIAIRVIADLKDSWIGKVKVRARLMEAYHLMASTTESALMGMLSHQMQIVLPLRATLGMVTPTSTAEVKARMQGKVI